MVTISSFSDRTNFLNFKHSVSEPANFDFVSPFTQTTFFSFVWGGGGGRGKQQYCVWKSYSVSALLCMLTTEMLLSRFGFIVIVRHSMQVYNYFLIKTQCVLCFYKTMAACLTGGGERSEAGSATQWQARALDLDFCTSVPSWWGTMVTHCPNAPFCDAVSSCPGWSLETSDGTLEMVRVPLDEVGRPPKSRAWLGKQQDKW